jgi:hypothetical protein
MLAVLAGLLLAPGCAPHSEVEGTSKVPMARETVVRFLHGLRTGDYATAARYFAGPITPLRAAYPDVPADDLAGLLERFMEETGGFCPDYEVGPGSLRTPICYPVTVVFCTGDDDARRPVEFLVYFDGRVYQILGLPPAGDAASLPPAA